jgi:hypothetical protein
MKIKQLLLGVSLFATSMFAMEGKTMTIFKSPSCGCCTKWADIMKENGFNIETTMVNDVIYVNHKLGILPQSSSCHTAIVDGYVVVGHVDYSAVKKMLENKPNIKGITVPGMPIGSPGMEQGDMKQSYNVLYITHDGKTGIFEKH